MRPALSHCRILSGLMLVATGPLSAASLEIGSPFLPAGAQSTAAVTAGAPIELHGYMVTPEGEAFSIYDPAKKSASWVKVNETGYPFVVRSHKVVNSTDQVTVDYQGGTLTLALKQSKIASAAQAGGAAPGLGFGGRAGGGFGPRGGGGPAQPAAAVVPTAEEVTRLQAAAADFQQRQAQRQQAQALLQATQGQQPVAPAGQVQGNFRGNGGQQGNGGGGGRRAQRAGQ